jgi:hypothetical protein
MKKLLLLFVMAMSIAAYSQTDESDDDNTNDFLIKTSGDTIRGKFKYKSGEGDIKNKITVKVNDTLKLTIKASEVKYFKDGKDEYITFQPEGEEGHFFIRIWTLGKYLELYEWQVPFDISGGSKIEYVPYIRKKGKSEFIEMDHAYWKKDLPEIIGDYEELADDVWRGKYKIEQLGEVITLYNEWKEDNK